jgi:hypothetical protein
MPARSGEARATEERVALGGIKLGSECRCGSVAAELPLGALRAIGGGLANVSPINPPDLLAPRRGGTLGTGEALRDGLGLKRPAVCTHNR